MGLSRGTSDGGQMAVDFITGMTIFIFTLFFVLNFMFNIVDPYTNTDNEKVGQVARVSERLLTEEFHEDGAGPMVLNYTALNRFFNRSDSSIRNISGMESYRGFNITARTDLTGYGRTDDRIGHWTFNEHRGRLVSDAALAGGRNTAVLRNGSSDLDVRGISSTSAVRVHGREDGSDPGNGDFVQVDYAGDMNVTDKNFSVAAWIHQNQSQNETVTVVGKNNTAFVLDLKDGDQPRFLVNNSGAGGPDVATDSSVTVEPDRWYHLVGVYTNDTIELYRNGNRIASDSSAYNAIDTDPGLEILIGYAGYDPGPHPILASDGPHYDGRIDEVMFYEEALTAQNVSDLYNASGIMSIDEPNVTTAATLNNTTLTVGAGTPEAATVASRTRIGHVPARDVGAVEIEVKIW